MLIFSLGSLISAQPNFLYEGDKGNGYSSDEYEAPNTFLFEGGDEAKYFAENEVNNNVLFLGNSGNGYSSILDYKDFVWTGSVGQSWTVPGNWNTNVVPDITRRIYIPSGVPAFPHINAGVLAIGNNPNNGAFKCAELHILPNALLVTRVNCRVENYGLINIEGLMTIKNSAYNAFQNMIGGEVNVFTNGTFSFY